MLPERRVEHAVEALVAAPGVVDQKIEATLLTLHAREQRGHFVVARMLVAGCRRATRAAPGDRLRDCVRLTDRGARCIHAGSIAEFRVRELKTA